MTTITFIEKFTNKWVKAFQQEEITRQFGGWLLCKNKTGFWLVSENYTQGNPNYGVFLGEDFQKVEHWFSSGNTEMLHNYFEAAYTSFTI